MCHLPHLKVDTKSIVIVRRLGSGGASEVFEARLPSFKDTVALKVFKEHRFDSIIYTRSKTSGHPLSPFDREERALSTIQNDCIARENSPVVEALGWFEIPQHFRSGGYRVSTSVPLKAIVKRVAPLSPLDFAVVSPTQMMQHREILNRLRLCDTDIKPENFRGGLLVDLSAFFDLNDITHPKLYSLDWQCALLKEAVLQEVGVFQYGSRQPLDVVERQWEALERLHNS